MGRSLKKGPYVVERLLEKVYKAEATGAREPIRTCVGCRTRAPADDLLRVVVVQGALAPDPRRRLPGRGAWLHPVPECLTRAERRSAFPRALRVPGPLDVDRVRSYLQSGTAARGPLRYDRGTTDASTASTTPSVTGVREPPGPANRESKVDPS